MADSEDRLSHSAFSRSWFAGEFATLGTRGSLAAGPGVGPLARGGDVAHAGIASAQIATRAHRSKSFCSILILLQMPMYLAQRLDSRLPALPSPPEENSSKCPNLP